LFLISELAQDAHDEIGAAMDGSGGIVFGLLLGLVGQRSFRLTSAGLVIGRYARNHCQSRCNSLKALSARSRRQRAGQRK